jgi:hypothetical protein|tara:strand:- start:631 stop:975 length:345 start_codon:yes stop_codon:yes gene_type:complete
MKLDLKEMEASEMIDVIHYFFEEDAHYQSGEEVESVSKMRTHLYSLYGQEYKYAVKGSSSAASGARQYVNEHEDLGFDDPLTSTRVSKGFVPATDVKGESPAPFGALLDPPIGG